MKGVVFLFVLLLVISSCKKSQKAHLNELLGLTGKPETSFSKDFVRKLEFYANKHSDFNLNLSDKEQAEANKLFHRFYALPNMEAMNKAMDRKKTMMESLRKKNSTSTAKVPSKSKVSKPMLKEDLEVKSFIDALKTAAKKNSIH